MIVSFSVSNFRSFAEEESLKLVASNRFPDSHSGHLVAIPGSGERLLRIAVLYGANGAGKSNLFKALQYFGSMMTASRQKNAGTGREAFRFREGQGEPSCFDLQFTTEGVLYRLGFKVDDQRVVEEWLIRIDGGREKIIYERATDAKGTVTIDARGLKGAGEKLLALATVGGPQNQTFLATIRATLEAKDYVEDLKHVFDWLGEKLTLVQPNWAFKALGYELSEHSDFLDFAGEFLKSSSTGVDRLEVDKDEISEDQLKSFLGEKRYSKMLQDAEEKGFAVTRLTPDTEILAERASTNRNFLITIQATHEHESGKAIPLDLSEESDGTQRLLNLIPALHYLRLRGGVFVIDEIDRSMHPLLTWKFLSFFLSSCASAQSQIIVTTHESNLLDLDLLRRDEIWFAEKNERGATKLYSLADYRVRTDLKVQKHYLQGRFGAVPFLGDVDRLLEKENAQ